MARSLDRQLDELEQIGAAAARVHSVPLGRSESREQAIARYEAANGPIGGGDLVVLIKDGEPDEQSTARVSKRKIVAVQRKAASPRLRSRSPERTWGGTTCEQPLAAEEDRKRDPYYSDWKKPLAYRDIYPSPDAGAGDERGLRRYAVNRGREYMGRDPNRYLVKPMSRG